MDSANPPQKKIKLVTTSKNQSFHIEMVFSRFSHLTEQIFDELDNVGLANCLGISRQWQSYLEDKRFFQIRIIKSKMAKDGKVGNSWEEFFKASNTKTIKYIVNSVIKLCPNGITLRNEDNFLEHVMLDVCLTPLHIAAVVGKLSIFKYIFDKFFCRY